MIETTEISEQGEVTKIEIDQHEKDEELTRALRRVADKIAPQTEVKAQPIKSRTRVKPEKVVLKTITRNILDELETSFGQSLRNEVLELEKTLRAEVEAQPYKPITAEKKDEIVWGIVNYEKQQDTLSKVLLEITTLINNGGKITEQKIGELIELSPGKKYLDPNSLMEKANFIEEAKKSIGTMHGETRKALVKYILSNKDILILKDFFEENNVQKQVDKVLIEEGGKNNEPVNTEKEVLIQLLLLFLKTSNLDMKNAIKMAEREGLEIRPFVARLYELTTTLRKAKTDPAKLERLVENILHRDENNRKKEKEKKIEYLNEIAENCKMINALQISTIASKNGVILSTVTLEAKILIKRIADNDKLENKKNRDEIVEEIADLSMKGELPKPKQ